MNSDPAPCARDALLVIGYGNTLRNDDGVGPRVADALDQLRLPGVSVITCHQLNPELAESVSQSTRVVFVDASVEAAREVRLRPIAASASTQLMAHAADPGTLLALARDVYGRCPATAEWLTIPIERLGFGEELSPFAQEGFQQAIAILKNLAAIRAA
ncbi:MAG: hydrogenase maturation protease [Verrucomicrobiota bacterium]